MQYPNHFILLLLCCLASIATNGLSQTADQIELEEEYQNIKEDLGYDETKKTLRLREKHLPERVQYKEDISFSSNVSFIIEILAYALVIILISGIIYLIFSNIKTDRKVINIEEGEEVIENIEDIDADKLYKTAIEQGDYRLAIRMHFIKTLQALTIKDHIEWQTEKTNRDYQREISLRPLSTDFRQIASVYESVWYGDQSIDYNSFKILDQLFLDLTNNYQLG